MVEMVQAALREVDLSLEQASAFKAALARQARELTASPAGSSSSAGIDSVPTERMAWHGVPPRHAISDDYPERPRAITLGEFGWVAAPPQANEMRSDVVVESCWIVQRVNRAERRSGRVLRRCRAASCWFVGRRG
jgi:hypothetical protein